MYYYNKIKIVKLFFFSITLLFFFPAIAEDQDIETIFSSNNYQAIKQLVEIEINKENPSAYIFQQYAQFLLNQSLTSEAIEQLLQAKDLSDADSYQIDYWLSYSYSLLGQYDQALVYANFYYEKNIYSEQALLEYVWLLYKNLKELEAISIAEEHIDQFPYSITLYSLLALLVGEKGNYEKASIYYDKVEEIADYLAVDPSYLITNYYNQFILEMQFLHFERAEAILQKVYAIAPDQPLILRLLGEFYHDQMDYNTSLSYYEKSELYEIEQVNNKKSLRTPLGKLGLIDLYLDFMHLDNAKTLIDEIKREKDKYAWMKSFGVNPIFFDTLWREKEIRYWKLLQQESTNSLYKSFLTKLKQLKFFFIIGYLEILQKNSYLRAINHAKNLQNIENRVHYSLAATSRYPLIQLNMLNQASTIINTPVNQQKLLYQEATAKNSIDLQKNLLLQLQSPYQNRTQASLLTTLLQNRKLTKDERLDYTSQLFVINPVLTQEFTMPMRLNIEANSQASKKLIKRFLKQIHIIENNSSMYTLQLKEHKDSLEVALFVENQKAKHFTVAFDAKSWRQIFEDIRIQIFYLQ